MNLSLEEISKAVGGTLDGPGNVKVRGYSIETRTLNPGELVLAIAALRLGGHESLEQAVDSTAEPNEGVVTNVNPVHLEFFKSVDEIAEAKAELLEGLHEPRTGYLNNDDSRVRSMARKFDGKIVTYGVKSVASFKVQQIQDL